MASLIVTIPSGQPTTFEVVHPTGVLYTFEAGVARDVEIAHVASVTTLITTKWPTAVVTPGPAEL